MNRKMLTLILAAMMIAGAIAWIAALGGGTERAYGALLANYTFFISLAGGLVVWPAIVVASNGDWMGRAEKAALAAVGFSLPSMLIFIALWATSGHWAPWVRNDGGHHLWLNNTFLFVRDGVLLAAFWLAARAFIRGRTAGEGKFKAGLLTFVYCVVFTFLGFDLVMAQQPDWKSNLFGAYFFISGLYIATAGWAVLSLVNRDYGGSALKDIGKLILSFCLLTTYMMYSQLLPLWYENIPDQTTYIRNRTNAAAWADISAVVSGIVYVGPLVLLFTSWAKKTPWFLAAVSLLVLAGMWMERWWLTAVQIGGIARFGWPELGALLFHAGAFGLAYLWAYSSRTLSSFGKGNNG